MSSRKRTSPKRVKQTLPVINSSRSCGECTACCVVFEITEMEKPQNVPCTHLCGEGCSVYPDRPSTCKEYLCPWIKGSLPLWMKPSSCGVLVEANPNRTRSLQLRELRLGALKSLEFRDWIRLAISAGFELILIPYSSPGEPLAIRTLIRK